MSFSLYNPFFSPPLYEIDNADFQENVERLYLLFNDLITLREDLEENPDDEDHQQFFTDKDETDRLIQIIRMYLRQNNIQENTITHEGLRLDEIIRRVEIIQPPEPLIYDYDSDEITPTFPVMMQLPTRTNTVDSVDTSEPTPSSREPSTIELEENEVDDIIKL